MIRIEIDLNVRNDKGLTRAALRDTHGAVVAVGDLVQVFEPDEDVEAPASVVEISKDGQFAFLDVKWNELRRSTGVLESVVMVNTAPRNPVWSFGQTIWRNRESNSDLILQA